MKSKLLSIICLLLNLCVNAQREADVLFSGKNDFSIPNSPPTSTTLFKFNNDSIEQIDNSCTIASSNFFSNATFSDKYGNFKFTSNGWRLVNSLGEVLSYKLWSNEIPWPNNQPDTTLIDCSKGPLFLTSPSDSNKVFLIYGQAKRQLTPNNAFTDRFDILLTFAILDIPTQKLISQNNLISSDTTSQSNVNAVRHANGRDWWLVKPGIFSNEYYVGLLDTKGFGEMQKITFQEIPAREQSFTIAHFNEEGTKLLHFTHWRSKFIQTYDFDRCTGELSNPQEYDLTGLLRNGENNNFAISPDGTNAYFEHMNWQDSLDYPPGTFQYDLESGAFTLLTKRYGSTFLSPNYKSIYFSSISIDSVGNRNFFLSEIKQPNSLGFECNLQMFKYPLINTPSMVTHPSYANYRLGALIGSPCDTIRPMLPYAGNTVIYPNPFASGFTLQLAEAPIIPMQLKVYNSVGQIVAESGITYQTTVITVKEGLAAGLYFVQLFDGQGKLVLKEKMVKNE